MCAAHQKSKRHQRRVKSFAGLTASHDKSECAEGSSSSVLSESDISEKKNITHDFTAAK